MTDRYLLKKQQKKLTASKFHIWKPGKSSKNFNIKKKGKKKRKKGKKGKKKGKKKRKKKEKK